MVIAIFERKVRSRRGANRAATKTQQANFDKPEIVSNGTNVNVWL
jgi:hypothetical protein